MTIYHERGRRPYIRLDELPPLDRAVFSAWLVGLDLPGEGQAWLDDWLRYLKARKERRACPTPTCF